MPTPGSLIGIPARWFFLVARRLEEHYSWAVSWLRPVLTTCQHNLLARLASSPWGGGILNHDHRLQPSIPDLFRRDLVLANISIYATRVYRRALRDRGVAADAIQDAREEVLRESRVRASSLNLHPAGTSAPTRPVPSVTNPHVRLPPADANGRRSW